MDVEPMNKWLLLMGLVLMAWNSNGAVYRVTGDPYVIVYGPNYTEDMQIVGQLEFADVLPANAEIDASEVLAFRFSDGVKTLDQDNAEIFFPAFRTGDDGLPFLYRIKVIQTPVTNMLGEVVSGIDLNMTVNTEGLERFEVGYTGTCYATGVTSPYCQLATYSEDGGFYSNPGPGGATPPLWVLLGSPTHAVPATGWWSMLLLMGCLVLVTRQRHKSSQR